MLVKVTWYEINDENKILWKISRGLYGYLGPADKILYIGKVDGTTVRKRFQPSAKPELWDFFVNDLEISEVRIIAGLVELPKGSRHSRQLLSDIESLLICNIQPPGNIACRNTRISRPGLSVFCCGDWSYYKSKFLDS